MKMQHFTSDSIDGTSVSLCMTTFFLNMMAEWTADSFASSATAIAATTTILYNLIKIYKESKNKK